MSCLVLKSIPTVVRNAVLRCDFKRSFFSFKKMSRSKEMKLQTDFNVNEYRVIYDFPQIQVFCTVLRRKNFKYTIMSAAVALALYFYAKEHMGTSYFLVFMSIVLSYAMAIKYASSIGMNMIGKIYLHHDRSHILISYAAFQGRRVNRKCDLHDVRIVEHPNFLYRKFFRQAIIVSTNKPLNLCILKTVKVDIMLFQTLFPNVL